MSRSVGVAFGMLTSVARGSTLLLLSAALLCLSAPVQAESYTIPWFEPPSAGGDPQGVLRIVNAAADAGTVTIHAIDDDGVRTGTAVLALNGSAAVDISAMELQTGDAARGLSSGVGNLSGGVRLALESDVPIVPLALLRAADGTLSAVHDTVLQSAAPGAAGYRYDVAVFHPASNVTQPSRLRLINPNDTAAQVAIDARDDAGTAASGGTVQLTLPPGGARTLRSRQLEAGDAAAFSGRLGAGVGNWRLSVSADRPIQVVNVAVGAGTGYWSNLSTTAVAGWAPQDAAAFEARFLGRTIVSRDGQNRATFQVLANGGFLHTYMDDGVEIRQESRYQYERTGRDSGLLRLDYDVGVSCEARFYFGSRISGWYAFACVDREDRVEVWTGNTWLSLDAGAMPLDLGSGPDDRVYTAGTAIETLTLPAASGGDGEFTYSLSPEVPGLRFDPDTRRLTGTPSEAGVWLMTYRVRDASGDTDWRYFNIGVQAAGGATTTFGTGDTIASLPTGSWTPDVTSNGTFRLSGGIATVSLDRGGYIEEGEHRYTCQSAGGCTIEDGRILSGTVARSSKGTGPGSGAGGGDDHGDDRATATEVEAGSDTEGMLESGDVDYFRVVVNAPGTLEAYTSGGTDTLGRLEDADGAVLGTNDDGGAGTNFRISVDVSAGTYFVRVAGYSSRVTGDYTLSVRFIESDSGTEMADRAVLMALYNAADGPNWASNANWGSSAPLSQWHGVTTDNSGRVTAINLGENRLSGSIPAELGNLSNLHTLVLSYNQLSGLIPAELGNLFNLTRLELRGNQFSGCIPDGLRDVSNSDLSTLGLAYCGDSGTSGGVQETTHGVGDTLSDLPTGSWTPDVTSGGSFLLSAGNATVRLDDDGYIEEGEYRYTCQNSGGCVIENRSVTTGTVVQTASGTAPGEGTGQDARPSFGAGSDPGDQTYTVGTAVPALMLPAASGGDGALTYSLSPEVPGLIFNATATVRRLTGTPSTAGTYDMTYRVRDADGDTDSLTFTVTVAESASEPDLVVESASVSDSDPSASASFTLSATVRNRGDGESGSTTLRYYRSSNATISRSDTQVGTDSVSGLSASGTSAESISLTAPSNAGTYYYGACVDSVSGESDTTNNCSSAVSVTVSGETGTQPDDYTPLAGLRVSAGRVQYGFFSAGGCIRLSNTTINGVTYTVHSSKWQRRDSASSAWEDVPGTEQQGGLCAYNPTTAGEYRLVGEVSINGVRGRYSSENTITVT